MLNFRAMKFGSIWSVTMQQAGSNVLGFAHENKILLAATAYMKPGSAGPE